MPHHITNDGDDIDLRYVRRAPDVKTLPGNAELSVLQDVLQKRGYVCSIIKGYLQVKPMSLLDALHIVGIAMEYNVYSAKIANDATDCAYNIYVETYSDPTGMSKKGA